MNQGGQELNSHESNSDVSIANRVESREKECWQHDALDGQAAFY